MTDDDITMTLNSETNSLYPCLCKDSEFCDPHHGHVVTGDLRFVNNPKPRKLFSKGPNYRENKTINYNKCMNEIKTAVDNFIASMTAKYKLSPHSLDNWKINVFEKVENKIKKLKSIGKPKATKPILKDEK